MCKIRRNYSEFFDKSAHFIFLPERLGIETTTVALKAERCGSFVIYKYYNVVPKILIIYFIFCTDNKRSKLANRGIQTIILYPAMRNKPESTKNTSVHYVRRQITITGYYVDTCSRSIEFQRSRL